MSWGKVALLAGAIVLALTAYAVGAGSKGSDDVLLCAAKGSGELTLGSHGKCGKGEKKLTIAKQGPAGKTGLKGDPGPKGDPGSNAVVVPEGVHYVTGSGSTACQANPGTFCKADNLSGRFENFAESSGGDIERVGYYKDPSGRVHLTGSAGWFTSGGSSGGFVPEGPFYLPVGYRPQHRLYFTVPSTDSYEAAGQPMPKTKSIEIRPDGLVYAPGSFDAFSLDGVSFRP